MSQSLKIQWVWKGDGIIKDWSGARIFLWKWLCKHVPCRYFLKSCCWEVLGVVGHEAEWRGQLGWQTGKNGALHYSRFRWALTMADLPPSLTPSCHCISSLSSFSCLILPPMLPPSLTPSPLFPPFCCHDHSPACPYPLSGRATHTKEPMHLYGRAWEEQGNCFLK